MTEEASNQKDIAQPNSNSPDEECPPGEPCQPERDETYRHSAPLSRSRPDPSLDFWGLPGSGRLRAYAIALGVFILVVLLLYILTHL